MLEAKLLAGNSGYDVVFPSLAPFFGQQLASGIYQPLDRTKLKNFSGIDRNILKTMAAFDEGNRHAIPYMWAATGSGPHVATVRENSTEERRHGEKGGRK